MTTAKPKPFQPPPKRQIPISLTGLELDGRFLFASGPAPNGWLEHPQVPRKPWRQPINSQYMP